MASFLADRRMSCLAHFLTVGLIALVIFEAFSFACWLLIPFFPSALNGDGKSIVSVVLDVETWLFYSLAVIVPVFVVLLLFSWILWSVKAILRLTGRSARFYMGASRKRMNVDGFFVGLHSRLESAFDSASWSRRRSVLVLALSCALASFLAAYPYLPSLNPSGRFVGVDIPYYANLWLPHSHKTLVKCLT